MCYARFMLAEKQADLIARYAIIPDPQERLAAIIARKPAVPPVPEAERAEELLVPGCQSRVWLRGRLEKGHCRFEMEAESVMVKGLVGLLCDFYDNAPASEIAAVEPELLEQMGIARNLTPTRLNGLAAVRNAIRAFAISHG